MISYITYAQLVEDTRLLIRKLPRAVLLDLVGVVGVPRSGMLPATMIATQLHLPVIDSYSFVRFNYQFSLSGDRVTTVPQGKTILVVDDSAYSGNSMAKALSVLGTGQGFSYVPAVVYRCPANKPDFLFARDVAKPRYFEWNLMQHPDMPTFMLDMDGVLCYDPPMRDDGQVEYVLYIKEADPLYIPRRPIHSICTMRLERYRLITENWLARQQATYGKLIMVDLSTPEDRRKIPSWGEWKGARYAESDAKLFIESDTSQAIAIAHYAKKPVICLANSTVYQENDDWQTSDKAKQ